MDIEKILRIIVCGFACLGCFFLFYWCATNIDKKTTAHILFWIGVFPILFFIFWQSIATIVEEINNLEYVDDFHDFIGQ